MRHWIHTASGLRFDLENPDPERVALTDIAAALSQINRYTGHTRRPYSVAEHSIVVSHMVPSADAFAGLMHDAHEAYIGDMAAPLKRMPELAGYREVEARIESVVLGRFGIDVIPDTVRTADYLALAVEARVLLGAGPWDGWGVFADEDDLRASCVAAFESAGEEPPDFDRLAVDDAR